MVTDVSPDGKRVAATPLDTVVDHIAYLVERLGEDGVGLGSDFDGAMIPEGIQDVAGLPNLVAAMRALKSAWDPDGILNPGVLID